MLFQVERNMKKKIIRLLFLALAAYGVGLCVALCYKTGWSADPITVFYAGLSKTFNISLGLANSLTALTMIITVAFIDKKQLGIGTVLAPIAIQFGIDHGMVLLPLIGGLLWRILFLGLAFIGLSFALAIIVCCDVGRTSYEGLCLSVGKLLKKPFYYIRWVTDGFLLLVGVLMGGTLSFAPFVAFLVLGKITDMFMKLVRKHWLPEEQEG